MKKFYMAVIALFMLMGCANHPSETQVPKITKRPRESLLKQVAYGNYEVVALQSFEASQNTKTILTIQDGKIYVEWPEEKELEILPGIQNVKSMAWHTNCGGVDEVAVVTEDGKGYTFTLQYPEDSASLKDALKDIEAKPIESEETVLSIGVYDDTTPFTTCGGDTFYLNLESGKSVSIYDHKERKEGHPYYNFLERTSKEENAITDVLYFFEDGTIHPGTANYSNQSTSWGDAITINDKPLIVEEVFVDHASDNVYLLSKDRTLYVNEKNDGTFIPLTDKVNSIQMEHIPNSSFSSSISFDDYVIEGELETWYGSMLMSDFHTAATNGRKHDVKRLYCEYYGTVENVICDDEVQTPLNYSFNWVEHKKDYVGDFAYLKLKGFEDVTLPTDRNACEVIKQNSIEGYAGRWVDCSVLSDDLHYYDIKEVTAEFDPEAYLSFSQSPYPSDLSIQYKDTLFYQLVSEHEIIPIPNCYADIGGNYYEQKLHQYYTGNISKADRSSISMSVIEYEDAYILTVTHASDSLPSGELCFAYGYILK